MSQLTMIPRNKLRSSPLNNYTLSDIDRMEAMIKAAGLLSPLTVIGPFEDGMYDIISGHRRYAGISKYAEESDYAGTFEEIPCNIVGSSDMNELSQRLRIQIANLESRDDTDKDEHRFELIGIMKDMKEAGMVTEQAMLEDLEKYMQVSPRYMRMYMTIFSNATEGTKQLLKDKKLAKVEAASLSYLPEKAQETAVEAILSGIPKKEVLEAVSEVKKNVKESQKKEQTEAEVSENSQTGKDLNEEKKFTAETESPFKDESLMRSSASYTENEIGKIARSYDENTFVDDSETDGDSYESYGGESDDDRYNAELEKFLKGMKPDIIRNGGVTKGTVNGKQLSGIEGQIVKWADNIMTKKSFTEEQYEVFDKLRELLDYVDESAYDAG